MTTTKRPHTVFVRSIGPTLTFATAERAHERARELVAMDGGYGEVVVWDRDNFGARTIYRYDAEPVVETFDMEHPERLWTPAESVPS